jgi:hypothetical protein
MYDREQRYYVLVISRNLNIDIIARQQSVVAEQREESQFSVL